MFRKRRKKQLFGLNGAKADEKKKRLCNEKNVVGGRVGKEGQQIARPKWREVDDRGSAVVILKRNEFWRKGGGDIRNETVLDLVRFPSG